MRRKLRTIPALRRAFRFFKPKQRSGSFAEANVVIVSFPKSGRTWLRVMLGKALCEQFHLPEALMLDTYRMTEAAGLLRVRFTHDYASIKRGCHYAELPADKSRFRDKKVIFLVRNIKDVLVSCYFQATLRQATSDLGNFTGSISDFVRSDRFGAKKIVTFYNIWHANQAVPAEFLLVSYEDMHRDAAQVLRQTLHVIGFPDPDPAVVAAAVEYARFSNLRAVESQNQFRHVILRPADASDHESYKLRRGVMKGYRDYLSKADIQYIDGVVAEMGCPLCSVE
jgi:hypothetical protein